MFSVAEAQAAIRARVPALAVEHLPLQALAGRVLRETIRMERDQPPFDRVAMDGMALRSEAVAGGRRSFRVSGTQAAGGAPLTLTSAEECLEAMTGAHLPIGCDAVVPVEKISLEAGVAELHPDVEIKPWQNIHRRGSDAKAGAVVLQPGVVLGGAEVAVIASAGHADTKVSALPRIMVISTGNELIEPGHPIESWQIRRSNSYALLATLARHGFTRPAHDHVADDLETLRERLRAHLENNDVLILSGGVSAGRFDYVPQVLSELGVVRVFHKIAQRPGKPMWFGVRDDGKTVYALPGNPVSTLICLRRYVIPGLYAAMGASVAAPETVPLSDAAKTSAELCIFLPVQLNQDETGRRWAEPKPTQGSGDFMSLLGTHGFVEISPTQGMMERGAVVTFYSW